MIRIIASTYTQFVEISRNIELYRGFVRLAYFQQDSVSTLFSGRKRTRRAKGMATRTPGFTTEISPVTAISAAARSHPRGVPAAVPLMGTYAS